MSARLEELKEKYGVVSRHEIAKDVSIFTEPLSMCYGLQYKGVLRLRNFPLTLMEDHGPDKLLEDVREAIKSGSKLKVDDDTTWDFTNLEVFR